MVEEVERVVVVGLTCIANLEPTAMNVELDGPALWRRRADGYPDVEVKTVLILHICDRCSSRRICKVSGIVVVMWLGTYWAKSCVVSW